MASEWLYQHGGQQQGPISSAQLRELSTTGGLNPSDLVWKEGMPDWVSANKLKGLFPTASAVPDPATRPGVAPNPPPLPTTPGMPSDLPPQKIGTTCPKCGEILHPSEKPPSFCPKCGNALVGVCGIWYERPVAIILFLVFFFPVGLWLTWRNPNWTTKRKWTVTGIVAGVFIIGRIGANNDQKQQDAPKASQQPVAANDSNNPPTPAGDASSTGGSSSAKDKAASEKAGEEIGKRLYLGMTTDEVKKLMATYGVTPERDIQVTTNDGTGELITYFSGEGAIEFVLPRAVDGTFRLFEVVIGGKNDVITQTKEQAEGRQ